MILNYNIDIEKVNCFYAYKRVFISSFWAINGYSSYPPPQTELRALLAPYARKENTPPIGRAALDFSGDDLLEKRAGREWDDGRRKISDRSVYNV